MAGDCAAALRVCVIVTHSTVIRIVKRVDGADTAADGQYLISYDPTIKDDVFTLTFTTDMHKARRFLTLASAVDCYRKISPNHPTRADGEPNRPLTAYTVSFVPFKPCPP